MRSGGGAAAVGHAGGGQRAEEHEARGRQRHGGHIVRYGGINLQTLARPFVETEEASVKLALSQADLELAGSALTGHASFARRARPGSKRGYGAHIPAHLGPQLSKGDVVAFFSNGSFGGAIEGLVQWLETNSGK